MNTQLLTGEDTRFLAQQPEYEVDIMVGQMTTLMQNITDLQNDTDDKVAQLQNQGWFKRMTNTLFGRNKATKQEIQKNNDKVMTYISQSVAQLYQMNLINERVICSLGNRMNEVYLQVTEMNQEMLTMKGQISQLMAVQQQTMEALGAFVNKLNEKIESVDNFHMMISEIQNGMYNDSSKLYNLCSILSQLDKRQMEDNRKMALLKDSMEKAGIITEDNITVQECLKEIVALPQEKIGLIYLELCNFRNSFPANLFADMIENYHFLSKMEKMSKKKEVLIQRVLDQYELDANATFSIADISESFFENKQECLVNINNLQIGVNDTSEDEEAANKWKIYDEAGGLEPDETGYDPDNVTAESLRYWAKRGDSLAKEDLGYALLFGEEDDDFGVPSIEKDVHEAAKWLEEAAKEGMMYSQKKFADMCYDGVGVQQNYQRAFKWYRKAAEQGYANAQYNLGYCYQNRIGIEKNEAEAVKWYRKAAEQGYANAQNALGYCYQNGIGIEKNEAEAVKWYPKAAKQGYATAQYNLGLCYENGKGVERNVVEAVKWYRKAAEQGDASAQNNLGVCYLNGTGCEEDETKAIKWFQKAVEQEHPSAEYNLGLCYYHGWGTSKDNGSAWFWMKKVAEQGYEDAIEFLNENF